MHRISPTEESQGREEQPDRSRGALRWADHDPKTFQIVCDAAEVVLRQLPSKVVATTITSPPYFRQKDYKVPGQVGWERNVHEYIEKLRVILRELLRITLDTGSCFVVIGDTYVNKALQLVPQRLVVAAQECGWTVRNDLIWEKLDAPPDNAADRWRFTHEHILFLLFLTKRPRGYTFNTNSIRVPYADKAISRWGNGQRYGGAKATSVSGPNGQRFARGRSFTLHPEGTIARDVLKHATARSALDHFATYPPELIERFLLATTMVGDLVLDPFSGTGTTGAVALKQGRRYLGIELNSEYAGLSRRQLEAVVRRDPARLGAGN